MQKFQTLLRTLAPLLIAALAPLAFAQMIPADRPPASPIIPTTPTPANCHPGSQDPSCPPIPAAPAPRTSPAPSSPPPTGGGLMTGFATGSSTAGMQKVVSYFQRGQMQIDTNKAFGFVLMPRSAITDDDRAVQRRFCQLMLASLDYMAPDAAASSKVLMTYWPVSTVVERWQVESAFRYRNCDNLIAWYDHSLARSIATKAEIAHLSGPLLITWPSQDPMYLDPREPLIVDFALADQANATKALQYWFRQLNGDPQLWTNRIREGTIRAELADAINDTAGVVVAVLYGKWDTVAAVSETP
jgi:hypothetical protein